MEKFSIDTRLEKAWLTFLVDDNGNTGGWEKEWFPIMFEGIQLPFGSGEAVKVIATRMFPNRTLGVSRTSQMLLGNAEIDNI